MSRNSALRGLVLQVEAVKFKASAFRACGRKLVHLNMTYIVSWWHLSGLASVWTLTKKISRDCKAKPNLPVARLLD